MSEPINTSARTVTGRVVSNKMNKTIVVLIERKVPHPKYGKYVSRRAKRFAHDEEMICKIGDMVVIKECRPLSKNKNWMLVKVLEKTAKASEENKK